MITTFVKVQVEADGTVRIPRDVWKALDIKPPQEVELALSVKPAALSHGPVPLTQEDRERLERIGELIDKTFAGMDWEEIHRARRD